MIARCFSSAWASVQPVKLETVGVRRGGGHTTWMFKRALNVSFPYITANRRILWEQKMASVKTGMMIGFNRGSLTVLRRSKWRSSNLRQTDEWWQSDLLRAQMNPRAASSFVQFIFAARLSWMSQPESPLTTVVFLLAGWPRRPRAQGK